MLKYHDIYLDFKAFLPEGTEFFAAKEIENFIDDADGMHVAFGMVVVPYILQTIQSNDDYVLKKIFDFLETMAKSQNTQIVEVLDFTILEQLVDEGVNTISICKQFMGSETYNHCKRIEQYFFNTGIQGID